jgi:glycerol-3-phosphate acyltransferase PlsY
MGLNLLLLGLIAYLLGSIPFGVIIGRLWRGVDIREGGSGHIGVLNTWRTAGWAPAALTAVGDLGKAALAVWLAQCFGMSPWAVTVAAPAVIIGHCWPVTIGFRGGMGMACGIAVLLVLAPLLFPLMAAIWGLWSLLFRHAPRASAATALTFPLVLWVLNVPPHMLALGILVGAVLFIRHTPDFTRRYERFWIG